MNLPRVPFRFTVGYHAERFGDEIFDAEILMLSLTTGSARVRLYRKGTNERVLSNLNVSIGDFLVQTLTINWE